MDAYKILLIFIVFITLTSAMQNKVQNNKNKNELKIDKNLSIRTDYRKKSDVLKYFENNFESNLAITSIENSDGDSINLSSYSEANHHNTLADKLINNLSTSNKVEKDFIRYEDCDSNIDSSYINISYNNSENFTYDTVIDNKFNKKASDKLIQNIELLLSGNKNDKSEFNFLPDNIFSVNNSNNGLKNPLDSNKPITNYKILRYSFDFTINSSDINEGFKESLKKIKMKINSLPKCTILFRGNMVLSELTNSRIDMLIKEISSNVSSDHIIRRSLENVNNFEINNKNRINLEIIY